MRIKMATILTAVVKEFSSDFSTLGQGSFERTFRNLGRFGTISRVLIIIKWPCVRVISKSEEIEWLRDEIRGETPLKIELI